MDVRVPLPKDEAATLLAALESAKDQFGQSPEKPVGEAPTGPTYTRTDALLDVARGFLQTAPEDRSGEDRTLLVVHVFAGSLAADQLQNVPAGTSSGAVDPICHIAGVGSIEPETARRLARDADLLGAVVDRNGRVRPLGRTRRLVSRMQRRERQAALGNVTSFRHPEARAIQTVGGDEGFDLHECVRALFSMRLPDQDQQAA